MNNNFLNLLEDMYQFGLSNDAANIDRSAKMRNVTPVTGRLLAMLLRIGKARRVLEIGTSNGYSTLWMAGALASSAGETVTTLEVDVQKAELAKENFKKSGLGERIDLQVADAGVYLKAQPDESFDFVFLDSDRVEYVSWWPDLMRIVKKGGFLAADNAVSHQAQIEPFLSVVKESAGFEHLVLNVEQGLVLIIKT